ncbi:hypothetical protein RAB80_014497 [Fusarium oxysporum f. sp. vasinfectum]|nr:hypothetical protein RAB80_014497 [Fusarium oxysporum f. sp. vasinfectum]
MPLGDWMHGELYSRYPDGIPRVEVVNNKRSEGSCLWQDLLTINAGGIGDMKPKYWAVVYVIDVDIDGAERVQEAVTTALPSDTWYLGRRDDHPHLVEKGFELIHTCYSILVGAKTPFYPATLKTSVEKSVASTGVGARVLVMESPHHVTGSGGLRFRPVFDWVHGVYTQIVQGTSFYGNGSNGLKRHLFGYPNLLVLFRSQFGTSADVRLLETLLGDENEKEQGGFGITSRPYAEMEFGNIYVEV